MIGAIDVGGTKIALGLVDDQGKVIARSETPSAQLMGYSAALEALSSGLGRLARGAGATLDGVGIGLTWPKRAGARGRELPILSTSQSAPASAAGLC
jgi:glucokinase